MTYPGFKEAKTVLNNPMAMKQVLRKQNIFTYS